ncbi:MAG: hypothetical protein LBO82_00200 [Synergistaceae bacterium]|jgi:hypothetical protein|nr:hypothetical protein [Synergistaceae bacterium]
MKWTDFKYKTDFRHKNGGFALPEVLCAIIILSLSILASFSAMSYALALTNESRGRMDDFSMIMRHGVAVNVWAETGDHKESEKPSTPKEIEEMWGKAEFSFAVGGTAMKASGGRLWLDVTEFRTSFDTPGKRRLMKSPVFVMFSTAKTADIPENGNIPAP